MCSRDIVLKNRSTRVSIIFLILLFLFLIFKGGQALIEGSYISGTIIIILFSSIIVLLVVKSHPNKNIREVHRLKVYKEKLLLYNFYQSLFNTQYFCTEIPKEVANISFAKKRNLSVENRTISFLNKEQTLTITALFVKDGKNRGEQTVWDQKDIGKIYKILKEYGYQVKTSTKKDLTFKPTSFW